MAFKAAEPEIRGGADGVERNAEALDVVVAEAFDEKDSLALADHEVLDRGGVGGPGVGPETDRRTHVVDDRDGHVTRRVELAANAND